MSGEHIAQGQYNWFFVEGTDGLASPAAPSATEINNGVNFGCSIDTFTAPSRTPGTVTFIPLCTRNERTVPGVATTASAQLILYRGDVPESEHSELLDEMKDLVDTSGFLVKALRASLNENGEVEAGDLVDVYPATISALNVVSADKGAIQTWQLDFTHAGEFEVNVVATAS